MKTRTKTERILQGIPLFEACSRRELRVLSSLCTGVSYDRGERLVHAGTAGHEFVVLISGSADVVRGHEVIATLTDGSPVGEMALLSGTPRNATVIASEPIEALVWSEREFASALGVSPTVRRAVLATATSRSDAAAAA